MDKQVIVHPVLFVAFPALFLFASNFYYSDWQVVVLPGLVTAAAGLVFWFLAHRFASSTETAAIILSLSFIAFFSFGPLYEFWFSNVGVNEGAKRILLICAGIALAAGGLFIKFWRFSSQLTYVMNIVGTVLVCVPINTILFSSYRAHTARQLLPQREVTQPRASAREDGIQAPDVYYLVLDGYSRKDVLAELYEYDNSAFLSDLDTRGFYVAHDSTSNYMQTLHSLASALNFEYLHERLGQQLQGYPDTKFVRELLSFNRLTRFLKTQDYSIVEVGSQVDFVKLGQADLTFDKWQLPKLFGGIFFKMTPFPWILRIAGWPLLHDTHRARIEYQFDALRDIAHIPGPKFVLAHILVGHPPFVFGPNGEATTPERMYSLFDRSAFFSLPGASRQEYVDGYRAHLNFLNKRITATLDAILTVSERPPVIVVQGDHGPGSRLDFTCVKDTNLKERFGILNAYYFPESEDEDLYDST